MLFFEKIYNSLLFVSDHFSDHCKLRGGVYFMDSIPTTASAKIVRKLVKEKIVALLNEQKD